MKKFLESDKAKKYNIDRQLIDLVLNAPSLNQEKVKKIKKMIQEGTYQIRINELIGLFLQKKLQFSF
jgi:anti-sigma28 factor (negative regulator of flagellin synthesis)